MLFLEHKHLLRQPYTVDPFPPADYVIPFGRGDVRRAGRRPHDRHVGRDRREVAAGRRRRLADRRASRSRSIDLRTISPVGPRPGGRVASPAPHRLLVVHEDVLTAGFGGEVAAWAAEHCFTDLDAPVRRVAAARHPRGLRAHAGAGHPAAGRRHRPRPARAVRLLSSSGRTCRWPGPLTRASAGDGDLSLHRRVDAADVVEGPGGVEGVVERVAVLEVLAVE